MILIDDRAGSDWLAECLPSALCSLTRLEYGDCCWIGSGPEGESLLIGVELKTLEDCLNSLVSGRLAGRQIPGMVRSYDHRYLIVQGRWWADSRTGALHYRRNKQVRVGGRGFTFNDLHNWLTTLESMTGTKLRRTLDRRETAYTVLGLYKWWTGKRWEKHRGHLMQDESDKPRLVAELPVTQRVAAQIDGIGWEKAAAVAKEFDSVLEMCCAEPKDWMRVYGVGRVLAQRAVRTLRGE